MGLPVSRTETRAAFGMSPERGPDTAADYRPGMLSDAEANHRSWFGRGRRRVDVDGVSVYLGDADAILAFPESTGDLVGAVELAREAGVREVGCWALRSDDALGAKLKGLGFQDGWRPHWMGFDLGQTVVEQGRAVEETAACSRVLPYWSAWHESTLGDDVHHFVVREGQAMAGHAVLNVDTETATGGIYDMGVTAGSRRRGHGRALALAALTRAGERGCAGVTLNATADGEPLYRSVGFASLGLGTTWWLFP